MGSLFKLIRSFFYLITGRMDKMREGVESNPTVVKAKYEAIVKDKITRAKSFMEAVAGLMATEETKKSKITSLTKEVENLTKLQNGALSKAKSRADKLIAEGKTMEDVKKDAEYIKHSSAYKDFSSTLKEKESRIDEIEEELSTLSGTVTNYKVQLESINREIDKLREESSEAVADIAAAKEQENISNALSNIAGDSTAEDLNSLRNQRQQIKNRAKISSDLAGTTVKAQEADYMEASALSDANDELDSLIFGKHDLPKTEELNVVKVGEKLPE
jgi:chromosome segregation ATPase